MRINYAWGAPSTVTGNPGDPETNKAIVIRVNQEFWNQKNLKVLDETHRLDSISHHNPVLPGNPLNFNAYKQAALMHLAAFPDLQVTNDDLIAEGDKVAVLWTATGTHKGELMGMPPTGRQIKWTGITIYRFANSKIVESWWSYDALGMMQQITAV